MKIPMKLPLISLSMIAKISPPTKFLVSDPSRNILIVEESSEEKKLSLAVQIEGKEHGTDLSYKLIEKYDLMKKIEEGIPLSSYSKDYVKRDIGAEFQVRKWICE